MNGVNPCGILQLLWLTRPGVAHRFRAPFHPFEPASRDQREQAIMKVRNSLKSLRGRHRDNRIVRRKGRVYVINKTQRRFKARQG